MICVLSRPKLFLTQGGQVSTLNVVCVKTISFRTDLTKAVWLWNILRHIFPSRSPITQLTFGVPPSCVLSRKTIRVPEGVIPGDLCGSIRSAKRLGAAGSVWRSVLTALESYIRRRSNGTVWACIRVKERWYAHLHFRAYTVARGFNKIMLKVSCLHYTPVS